MDDDREVIDRLGRIERLDGAGAPAAELLDEVRGLLRAAERLARRAEDDALDETVSRCRGALASGGHPREEEARRVVALDRVG